MKKKISITALLGIILYIVFISIAMIFYAGGSKDIPSSIGYYFWMNTFSDLGRTTAWNGLPNTISMILFSFAYGIHVITMVPYYLLFYAIFKGNSALDSKIGKIGSLFGILSSIAFIGIIFTPADILHTEHWIFVYIGYPSILLMDIAFAILLIRDERVSKLNSTLFIIFALIFVVAILFGLIGVSVSRTIMVIGQKISRMGIMISYIVLIWTTWKLE